MMKTFTLIFAALLILAADVSAQASRTIKVYPGARLVLDAPEAGEQPQCCTFAVKDAFSTVVAFYEKSFGQKAMDLKTYEKTYPAVKQLADAAQKAMPGSAVQPPPGAQARIFVLKVDQVPGLGKMPTETFTIASYKNETSFDISENQLGPDGEKFAYEFRKKYGQESGGDRTYKEWTGTHPPARQEKYNLPVYPGAVVSDEQYRGTTCYNAVLQTRDPFEKVVAFYRERLKGKLPEADTNGKEGYEDQFTFIDYRYAVADPGEGDMPGSKTRILGKKGSVNRYVEIQRGGQDQDYQTFDEKSKTYEKAASVRINLMYTVLDEACTAIPKNAVWKENEKVDPKSYSGFHMREE